MRSKILRLIVRMFSAPGETSFDLAGDTVTERLKSILGSVYDGDPGPLQALVEGGASDLEWIEGRLRHPDRRHRQEYAIITDAIAEMEWWASFHQGERPKKGPGPVAYGDAEQIRIPAASAANQDRSQRSVPLRQRQEIQEVLRQELTASPVPRSSSSSPGSPSPGGRKMKPGL